MPNSDSQIACSATDFVKWTRNFDRAVLQQAEDVARMVGQEYGLTKAGTFDGVFLKHIVGPKAKLSVFGSFAAKVEVSFSDINGEGKIGRTVWVGPGNLIQLDFKKAFFHPYEGGSEIRLCDAAKREIADRIAKDLDRQGYQIQPNRAQNLSAG